MLWFELHVYQFHAALPYTSASLLGPAWSPWPLTLWPHRIIFSFGVFFCLTWDNLPHLSGHQTTMPASSWCLQKIKSPEAREGSSYSMRQPAWQGGAGEDAMAKDASDPFLLLFSSIRYKGLAWDGLHQLFGSLINFSPCFSAKPTELWGISVKLLSLPANRYLVSPTLFHRTKYLKNRWSTPVMTECTNDL